MISEFVQLTDMCDSVHPMSDNVNKTKQVKLKFSIGANSKLKVWVASGLAK